MNGTGHVPAPSNRRGAAGVLACVLLLACLAAQPAGARQSESATGGAARKPTAHVQAVLAPDRLAAEVTGARVYRHLEALQSIADAHGGNRGYDRAGFTASVRYVVATLRAAGYHVAEQPVPYTDFDVRVEQLAVTGAGPRTVPALMTRFTPSTSVRGLDARLVSLPTGRTGCTGDDYAGTGARGAVVVIARAACGYGTQQEAAAQAGARAVLLYYPTPSPRNIYRLIAYRPFAVPVASVAQRDGERLAQAAARGRVRVHLTLRARSVPRTTVNVLAETAGGDPGSVVLLGAHLDSVTEGPGINDNGSTAATVLQTALALAPYQHRVAHKVRFAWWGAEELVDVGSDHYVATLSAAEKRRITAVLNGELIASPNDGRFVWDPGSGGGHAVAALFARYFDRHGLPYQRTSPDSVGSDHEPFEAVGIAVGGIDGGNLGVKTPEQQHLFGGKAGRMFDPCYHQPCDRIGDINRRALAANAPAFAWVLASLAEDTTAVRAACDAGGCR